MTDSEPSSINILIRLNSGIAEIKVPIEKLKIELDAILEKFQYLIKPSITTPMVEIEELQFEVAITDDGRLAVLSANVTEHDVGYTIKLRVRRTETDWKFSEPAITPAQVTQTDLVKHVPAAKQTTYPRSSGNEYSLPATAKTPALIIFLLDVSASMKQPYSEGTKKIDEISNLLQSIAVRMVQRSTKGTMVTPRYRIAMYAYSSQVIDLLGGIKTIEELAALGVPKLTTLDMSDVNAAFCEVEQLLKIELPHLQNCPAPLIYHITDGEYNGANPQPVVQRIMEMGTLDGRVLISNVTYDNEILHTIPDIDSWSGYQAREEVPTLLGQTLFEMSSMLPDRYRSVMREFGFRLGDNSRMLFPAKFKDLIEISFVMSGATPVVRN